MKSHPTTNTATQYTCYTPRADSSKQHVSSVDKEAIHFFEAAKTDKTRNSEGKIFVKQFHSNIGKSTFSNRVITNWNNLPAALKFANSINLFKNLLDNDSKFKVRF